MATKTLRAIRLDADDRRRIAESLLCYRDALAEILTTIHRRNPDAVLGDRLRAELPALEALHARIGGAA